MIPRKSLTNRLRPTHSPSIPPSLTSAVLVGFSLSLLTAASTTTVSGGSNQPRGESHIEKESVQEKNPLSLEQTDLHGLTLHDAFIARMREVKGNLMRLEAYHRASAGIGPDSAPTDPLPELRVFTNALESQGPESELYDALITVAGMVASEERGELTFEESPGHWIKKPPLYRELSEGLESGLRQLAAKPELRPKLEWVIENKYLPLIEKLTQESMSLGGVIRHFSESNGFETVEDLPTSLSMFAKLSFLSTANEWAKQNDLPQLDLRKHFAETYLHAHFDKNVDMERLGALVSSREEIQRFALPAPALARVFEMPTQKPSLSPM